MSNILQDFIQYNKYCPVCNNKLTLMMQWHYASLWKAYQTDPQTFQFSPKLFHEKKDDKIVLIVKNDQLELYFSSAELEEACKKQEIYFSFLCQEEAIHTISDYDYEISAYQSCYFRSSPDFNFQQIGSNNFQLKPKNITNTNINEEETFTIIEKIQDGENIYVFNQSNTNQSCKLFHYSASQQQLTDKDYSPQLFEKEMPLTDYQLDFSLNNRDKLISKFQTWINLS